MRFRENLFEWPASTGAWIAWAIVLALIFTVVYYAAGSPTAGLAVVTAGLGYSIERKFHIPVAILLTAIIFLIAVHHPKVKLNLHSVVRESLFIGIGFSLYELFRKVTEGEETQALSNSGRVLDFEQRLRLNFESALQNLVIDNHTAVTIFARIYSSFYLPVVICGLLWFLLSDGFGYRVLRNALGISAVLSLLTFWLYPVAPPRLLPAAETIDMHGLLGRQHGFVNEFAAVPSLHVGWTFLVGYVFYRSYRRNRWSMLAWIPGWVMFLTVIVTGNHYWFDGAIGILYTLVPAAFLFDLPNISRWWERWISLPGDRRHLPFYRSVWASPWAMFDVGALGVLLLCMVIGQIVNPGFTGYWGYIVAQIGATIVAVSWISKLFASEGGLSWLTHMIIVAVTYADTLGTAADFYDSYQVYDKITHFGGGAILAATAYEILLSLEVRGAISIGMFRRMAVACAVSVGLGATWEFYEVFGDAIFDTGRHAGSLDTIYDLISDSAGAILTVVMLSYLEPVRASGRARSPLVGREHSPLQKTGQMS